MKRSFLFAFLFMFAITAVAQAPTADAVLKPVYEAAAKSNKNVLVIFHASWCGWCRKMDSSLADPSIKDIIDRNYEIAHLTVYEHEGKKALENGGALELLTTWGGADKGLPYWVVLDAKGNKLSDSQYKPGENVGCPAAEAEVAHLLNVLRKTATVTDAELEKVRVVFRKNDTR